METTPRFKVGDMVIYEWWDNIPARIIDVYYDHYTMKYKYALDFQTFSTQFVSIETTSVSVTVDIRGAQLSVDSASQLSVSGSDLFFAENG